MNSKTLHTIVEYLGEDNGSSCGYCKSTSKSSCAYGMWAHMMSVTDYQGLIDRGWRRSGYYCYKPIMEKNCCALYTIRCAALEFKISKSQKKVIKKFNTYVVADKSKGTSSKCSQNITASKDTDTHVTEGNPVKEQWSKQLKLKESINSAAIDSLPLEETQSNTTSCDPAGKSSESNDSPSSAKNECEVEKASIHGLTAEHQNKSKVLRKERKRIKLLKEGYTEEEVNIKLKPNKQQEKTLEEFLSEGLSSDPRQKLKVQLVRCSPLSSECDQTSKESYELYQRYQMAVHNSSADDCSFHQYKRFLVNSPLQAWKPQHGPSEGYGSFHQQYWLDGKLIAVGVIDILPKCISSVYFFYDPDLAILSLGTYGSLREIAMVRSLQQQVSSITFYYLGYYINSCPKMQYKANYKPSYLLCPQMYTWHPFEECKQNFQQQRYARLNPDITAAEDDECNVKIDEVLVLYKNMATLYACYKHFKGDTTENEDNEVLQYAKLVGKSRSKSMLLYRADD